MKRQEETGPEGATSDRKETKGVSGLVIAFIVVCGCLLAAGWTIYRFWRVTDRQDAIIVQHKKLAEDHERIIKALEEGLKLKGESLDLCRQTNQSNHESLDKCSILSDQCDKTGAMLESCLQTLRRVNISYQECVDRMNGGNTVFMGDGVHAERTASSDRFLALAH